MFPGIEINTTNATTFSTPTVASETGENTIHNLGLRYTPGGSEEWNRMVENGFKPALGLMFVKLEEAIEFYNLYAVACGFIPRKYTQTRFRDGLIDKKSMELIGYAIDTFYEGHNHRLCSLKEREFQKNVRTLNLYMKQTIVNNCKLNIGATKTFRIMAEQSNGYANIGASLTEFKNFKRNIKCYIGDKDADMILDYLKALSESQDGFYYAYQVDEDNCLAKIFWTDAQARMNYSLFGDTITFDPTYGTNKYHMAFTPFTGVDNHKKSVTFAAAFVDHENDGSFIWVFKKFLDCMGNKEPQCIITDQDPAIKLGVRYVFKKARHRYCMWHIMKKLTDKVESQICKETDFVERICGVVWDTDLEPIEFEEKWTQVINDFELNDNTWLPYMYGKRHKWIHAYFRDLPLGCLLKTTQRSESQNSYFKRFESIDGTLVEFWLRFQSAIEQQRYNHRFLDAVAHNNESKETTCTCKMFERKGILCKHIIWIISGKGLQSIPEQYIETRWTKKSYRKPLYELDGKLLQDYDPTDLRKLELSRVWSEFYATISVLNSMPENQIKELSLMLLQFREKINPTKESLTKDQELEMLLGCSAKSNITVLPPKIAKNKGSGKRMKSNKDKAIEKASKPKRLCNNC
ncbi:protein FAR1-RELATED SEQUENCE 5-like [Silene latifolia]|uniref:protein FAR1-RELATED SEQUENCE 5-like n=1 Tax=Silene latifolia TaxID=37657 RepID=UPI003D76B8CA